MYLSQTTKNLMLEYNKKLERIINALGYYDLHPEIVTENNFHKYANIHNTFDKIAREQDQLRVLIEQQLGRKITKDECLTGFKTEKEKGIKKREYVS